MSSGRVGYGEARRLAAAIAAVFCAAVAVRATAAPYVTADAVYVIDNASGEVLFERAATRRLPPASTTKVLTALLALRSGKLDEPVTVSARAASMPPTRAGLRAGWKVRLEDLVYAALLPSGNDAAVAVAEAVAGSVEQFAGLMNATARSLGAVDSHFVNPHGLPARRHYSTAADLVTIFRHALNYPRFRRMLSERRYVVRAVEPHRRITVRNRNRLLRRSSPTVILGKTGYTRRAGRCFVGMAERDGREVVFALLRSRDLWGDIRRVVAFALPRASRGDPALSEPEWLQVLVPLPGDASAVAQGGFEEGEEEVDRFQVRLASFRSPSRAQRLARGVESEGYEVEVERIQGRGRPWYRVTVNGFPTREEAEEAARRLARRYRVRPLVVPRRA